MNELNENQQAFDLDSLLESAFENADGVAPDDEPVEASDLSLASDEDLRVDEFGPIDVPEASDHIASDVDQDQDQDQTLALESKPEIESEPDALERLNAVSDYRLGFGDSNALAPIGVMRQALQAQRVNANNKPDAEHTAIPTGQQQQQQQQQQASAASVFAMAGAGLVSVTGKAIGAAADKAFGWSATRINNRFDSTVSSLSGDLSRLESRIGLDKNATPEQQAERVSNFFNNDENRKLRDALYRKADNLIKDARKLVSAGERTGMKPDQMMGRVLEPMRDLANRHEKLLDMIKKDGQMSLLGKLDNTMNDLFQTIKEMLSKFTQALTGGKSSGPRMG